MKTAALALIAILSGTAIAQLAPADPQAAAQAQLASLRSDRNQVENKFNENEKDCYQKFAVNDCIARARVVRREALADLRRQELSVNAIEARRKAAQQISKTEEKLSPQAMREVEQRLLDAQAEQQARLKSMDERTAARAAAAQEAPERLRERQERMEARDRALKERAAMLEARAENRRVFEQKQLDAQKRREESKKRQPERKPAPVPALVPAPTPAKPAS